jgi:16S rRNA (guanine527-N7)-methyltransferase
MSTGADPAGADRVRALALVPVSRETEADFETLVQQLTRWQAVKNLVGPATLPEVWTRHVADSAQLAGLVPAARRWLDLGSGAGFPGLVIAILMKGRTGAHVTLVESNGRKCAFLHEIVRLLGLPASVVNARIEDAVPALPGPFDAVTARALAPLPVLLGWTEKLLTSGVVGVFPKGQDVEAELTESAKCWRIHASIAASITNPEAGIVIVQGLEPRIVS